MAKILLVEDDPELLKSYEDTLKADGHSIVKAVDGVDGFSKVQNQKFDLIMTDLQMPKMTGQKFVELLQKGDNAIACPIIISSGCIDNDVINSFSGNTRIHFLPKPTSAKEIKAKVKELLTAGAQRSKIDVRFINPVLSSTIEVITSMTKFSITAGKPHVKAPGERSGDISGVVGVVGSGFKGTISLSFSDAGFLAVISKMFEEEIKERKEIEIDEKMFDKDLNFNEHMLT